MEARTYYPFPETFDASLCVLPTDGESQYEAFQSIFSSIMSARDHRTNPTNDEPYSPYELLCKEYGITLIESKNKPRVPKNKLVIYFKPHDDDGTHYIALYNDQIRNPYDYYQQVDTQGYCQSFAFFLAINELSEFTDVNQKNKIDKDNFDKFVINNMACLTKILQHIYKNEEVYKSFKYYFTKLHKENREYYGIKLNTTVEQYFRDFSIINNKRTFVSAYVYDQPLVGYNSDAPRPELWFLVNYPPPKYSNKIPSIIVNSNVNMGNAAMPGGSRKKKYKRTTYKKKRN